MSEAILEALQGAVLRLLRPGGELYWVYVASAAAIAFAVYVRRRHGAERPSLRGFVAFALPPEIYRHPSARLDFAYFIANVVVYGGFVGPLLLTSGTAAEVTVRALVRAFGIPEVPIPRGPAAVLTVTIALPVAADLAFYVSHSLQHRSRLLWEFHKVHHSAEVLHPITAFRVHPLDQALDATFIGGATGVVLGVAAYAFGTSVDPLEMLGTNVIVFLFQLAGAHLRHSHVWLSFGPVLDRIFVSPALHQLHHGMAPHLHDRNLGGMLTIWDRIAGTLYVPSRRERITVGLAHADRDAYASVAALYLTPFRKLLS